MLSIFSVEMFQRYPQQCPESQYCTDWAGIMSVKAAACLGSQQPAAAWSGSEDESHLGPKTMCGDELG